MNAKIPTKNAEAVEPDGSLPVEIPALIIGGGPVGLSMSMLLSHHGIRSLLVEQHSGTSLIPKARFINARTMEIFRQIGIEEEIQAVGIEHARNVVWAPSLAGQEIAHRLVETMAPEAVRDWSSACPCTSTQEIFEPILLTQARSFEPAQVRFNTQLISFEQREDHLIATLVHRPSGRVKQVRAQYLIGADGGHSQVREALAIRMIGQPVLGNYINILFRADLSSWAADREINLCFITNPAATGLLLYNGGNRWGFMAFYFPDKGQRAEDFTPERCLQIIRTAVGVPDLPIDLVRTEPWNDAAQVAEHFSDRRVFLAGDATHLMSPAGGFGMNVGIQAAHNLAWKLAGVLNAWAAPELLESYEAERAPVSRVMIEQMMRNISSVRATTANGQDSAGVQASERPPVGRPEFFREHGLVFGATYDSAAIVPDGTARVQVTNPVTDYVPNARPGSRAPHVWLEQQGKRISTLDLFGREFVLLTGVAGQRWCDATKQVSQLQSVPIQSFRVGLGGELSDADHQWATTYGVEGDGAVLVRPDGYVAWRSPSTSSDAQREMNRAISAATGKLIH